MIFRGGSEFNDPALDPRRSHNFPLNGFTITPYSFLRHKPGLDETLVSVSISRISRSKFLVSVSYQSRKIILQTSRSRIGLGKSFYKSLSLVSVSKNDFSEVSVLSRVSGFRSKISRNF